MIFNILLPIHIIFGSISIISSIAAISLKKGSYWHRRFGGWYFFSMTGIFFTAMPMAYLHQNLFLALIALFSYYLAYSGWRYAKQKSLNIPRYDWAVTILMVLISLTMICLGILQFDFHQFEPIVLLVFGGLSLSFSLGDLKLYLSDHSSHKIRITKHLTAMLGSTIAVFTAVLVTNVHIKPAIILWLSPTIVFTPFIVYWTNKINKIKE